MADRQLMCCLARLNICLPRLVLVATGTAAVMFSAATISLGNNTALAPTKAPACKNVGTGKILTTLNLGNIADNHRC